MHAGEAAMLYRKQSQPGEHVITTKEEGKGATDQVVEE